ncbi:glycosyltransferase family 117 protein [Pedobacter sp. GR22-6]|uniref:glycosyltransferase family 117 protein n=1 Tax=Pedobacter sp. GR22-6 TaxID=3127957 RepID=UPI00307F42E0
MHLDQYKKINNWTGFLLFATALIVYTLTLEPTLSFWDCGEFITAADKLQVGHQPGAPLFLMIGKLFALLAAGDTAKIAYWMNFSSALFSAATVMFLFWTITALASKCYPGKRSMNERLGIIASGAIGALAFTFSDTFWFSAVEAEVYSLSMLFTAMVFWAILKWENQANDRWLVLIAFIVGLSIGVHLLSLLAIPAIVLVYYFKKTSSPSLPGIAKAIAVSGLIWATVQFIIVQYFVLFAAKLDLLFVNTFGLAFGSGAISFVALLAAAIVYGIHYSIKHRKYKLNLGLICLSFVLLGFSSYFLIIIRANAKPSLNLSSPDNAYSLYNYLGRVNYGQTPFLYGQTFDAERTDIKETGLEYRRGKEKYEVSGKSMKVIYDKNMLFPRTYSDKPQHVDFYRNWLGLGENESPSFAKNLKFFSSYQMGFMYWRYFLWNFAGRQNDVQGQGSNDEGNWISGIKAIDASRLGNQAKLPESITANEGYNRFYFLPLLMGIAGLIFLYRKNRNDALVVLTLFVCTGLAIIVYLNQDPLQVRERDYAYVGSFYAFSILIGFGVMAIKALLARINAPQLSLIIATVAGLIAAPGIMGFEGWDDHNRSGKTTALDWASNYLNSCAPNAILFTNADNDTFPLWYAQEVEGIRTDVRVVNMQYLSDDAYINQMKQQLNQSAPLPIKMDGDKYVKGVRDYLYYIDYGFTDSVELKDLMAVLTSDHKEDQKEFTDGDYDNFLPTKKFKITIDAAQLLKTGTIKATEKDKLASEMEWTYNKNYVLKSDLALFDILANNNWERPIYFATSVSEDTYIGLDKYLYLEGYAHRLLPFKVDPNDERDKMERTNSEQMYDNIMHKFSFKGFKTAAYLDPESRRIAQGTWQLNNTLASNLIAEGKPEMAHQVLLKNIHEFPSKNYSINDTVNKFLTIRSLYQLNDLSNANPLISQTISYLDQELNYITSLDPRMLPAYTRDIKISLSMLYELDKMTAEKKQMPLNQQIREQYQRLEARLSS